MIHRWKLYAVCGLCLACAACGNKADFDENVAKDTIGAAPVNLDAEQVTITGSQLDCGVQSELWEAPTQVSENRKTARLTAQGRALNFSDDPAIEPTFHQPYAQVRGPFVVTVGEVSAIRDAENGTKMVEAKAAIRVPHACFANPLPLMGVKHGNFREDTPVSFLFHRTDDGWRLEKIVH